MKKLINALMLALLAIGISVPTAPAAAGPARISSGTFNPIVTPVFSPVTGRARRVVLTSYSLPKLAAGIARVKAGQGRAILADIGDSVTAGWGSNGTSGGNTPGTGGVYLKSNSLPHQLAALFTGIGIPSRSDALFSGLQKGQAIADLLSANPNVTAGTGWAISNTTGGDSLGGMMIQADNTVTTAFTFAPEFAANSFDLLLSANSSTGGFTVTDSDGTLATINTRNTPGFVRVTVSRAASSTKAISITPTSSPTGKIYLVGIIPYDTTSPRLELLNMGYPGSTSTDWTATGAQQSMLNALGVFSGFADASTIELGLNDSNKAATAATLQANLQTIGGKVQPYGDVLIIKPHQASPSTSAYNMPASYLTAMDTVAGSVSLALPVNFNALTFSASNYYDGVHLTQSGYSIEAQVEFAALRAATGN